MEQKGEKAEIRATIGLPKSAKSVAFAVHVQAVRTVDGERILPAIMNDNYFTLSRVKIKRLLLTLTSLC